MFTYFNLFLDSSFVTFLSKPGVESDHVESFIRAFNLAVGAIYLIFQLKIPNFVIYSINLNPIKTRILMNQIFD
jgi:hypothetical protein